ncbi:phage scaffolding protein [Staphylococcus hyicus]|uniref:phage scaffolding protein n=1 Tax=Staphylococcus hyicus TaxID=1284 RepID=UPI00211BA479|nr:phage scaffolding protein [Staphylococcus hyicus]MCQ9290697.1 phage scaffolding protein [Staphylococcus hyicus]MCQ9305939.1 phage scaffolding protein [Staphylococcus hyicus]MCQ9308351.1 phage scaffolding protein [Staphylococcus hyicus]MCQ9310773.1 phage scaffolding protein [Staphylococcus hyicus]
MAFSRENLREIGVDEDKIEQIMSLHGKEVQGIKDQLSDYKSKSEYAQEEIDSYKKRIKEKDSELTDLQKKADNGEDLKEQIQALREAGKEKETQHQQEMNKLKLKYEVSKALTSAGARNERAVLALINTDELKLSNEGQGIIGLEEQLKALKDTDSYLFNVSENSNDANNGSNNQDNGNYNQHINDYNAGSNQGNNGRGDDETAIGKSNARRLFGKQ